jgi:hypothetical protein
VSRVIVRVDRVTVTGSDAARAAVAGTPAALAEAIRRAVAPPPRGTVSAPDRALVRVHMNRGAALGPEDLAAVVAAAIGTTEERPGGRR